jgi:hypothetical protein
MKELKNVYPIDRSRLAASMKSSCLVEDGTTFLPLLTGRVIQVVFCNISLHLLAIIGTIALLESVNPASAEKAKVEKASKPVTLSGLLDPVVAELLSSAFPSKSCSNPEFHPTIGLWTFTQDQAPVSEGSARRIYDELLARIMKQKPRCVEVLDSAGIGAVIHHLSKSGALEQSGGNTLGALQEAHQAVDFVMFPDLFEQNGKVYLSMRVAERKTGRTEAVAQPVEIPASFTKAEVGDAAKSLHAALSAASAELLSGSQTITEITPTGLYFEDSFAQPEVGRFLMDQLLANLVQRGSNSITGKMLRVRAITMERSEPAEADEGDGGGSILPEEKARLEGSYLLAGRYWLRGDALELVLTLTAPDGAKRMWRESIRRSEFEGMEVEPKNASALTPPLPPSDYVFEVTTERGVNPVFRAGDVLNLRIRLNRRAWVYCFYVNSMGGVTPIFPLPSDMAGNRKNPLKPKRTMLLPDPAVDKFRFRFTAETVGEELVSCYATGRDVARDLPDEMFPEKPAVVPFLTLDTVRQRFRMLPDAAVTESLITMTIAK